MKSTAPVVLFKKVITDKDKPMSNPYVVLQKHAQGLIDSGQAADIGEATAAAMRARPDAYAVYRQKVLNGTQVTETAKMQDAMGPAMPPRGTYGADDDSAAKKLYDRIHEMALARFNSGQARTLTEALAQIATDNAELYRQYQRAISVRV